MRFNNKEISAAIFDMDGTMFDTEKLRMEMMKTAAKEICGKEVSNEVLLGSLGLNFKASERLAKEHYGEDFPYKEIRDRADKLEVDFIRKNGMPVKDGLFDVLEIFKKSKIPMAIATSSKRELVEEYIDNAGVRKYFDAIVCGDEVKNSKPDPEIFLKAAEKLKIDERKALVFEDSENGLKAGIAAGMLPVFVKDMIYPVDEVRNKAFVQYEGMTSFVDDLKKSIDKLPMPALGESFPEKSNKMKIGIHGFGAIGGGYWTQVFSHWDGYTRPMEIQGATGDKFAKELINARGNFQVRYDKSGIEQKIDNVKALDINDADKMIKMYKDSDVVALCLPEAAIRSQAKNIAQGLVDRYATNKSDLTILFVFNKVDGEKFLKENVKGALTEIVGEERAKEVMGKTTFVETVVNRMVSNVPKAQVMKEIQRGFEKVVNDSVNKKLQDKDFLRLNLPSVREKIASNPLNAALSSDELNKKAFVTLGALMKIDGGRQLDKVMTEMPLIVEQLQRHKDVNFTLFNSEPNMPLYAKGGSPIIDNLRQVEPVPNIHSIEVMKNRLSNGPHAVIAWYSSILGYNTIGEGLKDTRVENLALNVMKNEIKPALLKAEPELTPDKVDTFTKEFIERCKESMSDPCSRVGKDPMRKLASGERVVGSIESARAGNIATSGLEFGVAAGIMYAIKNAKPEEKECVQIKEIFEKNNSIRDVLTYTGDYNGKKYKCLDASKDSELIGRIEVEFNKLSKEIAYTNKQDNKQQKSESERFQNFVHGKSKEESGLKHVM